MNESWKNFGDICFAQVKFPDFSEFHEILWLFSSATKFLNFYRSPEIPGPLATLYVYDGWKGKYYLQIISDFTFYKELLEGVCQLQIQTISCIKYHNFFMLTIEQQNI